MYKEELQESLDELLGGNDNYLFKVKSDGTIAIHTKLIEREDGRLINKNEEVDDEDDDELSGTSLNMY